MKSKNRLYTSFHSQVRARSRIPEDNEWDKGRTAAESTIHPNYHEEINFAALSLDGFGVLWWGDYSMTLKELHIASRTTVFEENPFIFCERHKVIAGKAPPSGYRATWARRSDLGLAKLAPMITSATQPSSYAQILLQQGASKDKADFIECHIFGHVHPTSVERVVGPKPKAAPDIGIWRSIVAALRKAGVIVEEV